MIRFFSLLAIFTALATLHPAQADILPDFQGKHLGKYIWGSPPADFDKPYLEQSKFPHNIRWDDDDWSPDVWIEHRGSTQAVIDGFYAGGLITDQDTDNGVPVLKVGYNFLSLSSRDKSRVVEFMARTQGLSYLSIHEDRYCTEIGLYSEASGLQLQ